MRKLLLFVFVFATILFLIDSFFSFRKHNIILISVDTLRADYLSCYNTTASPTPEIDSLARKGTLFQQAYSIMPITLPAHASLLTSHPPHEMNLFDNGQTYQGKFPTLAELLAAEGYSTAAFVSLGVLKKKFGLDKGFQTYNDVFSAQWYRPASKVNQEVFSWLDALEDKPFFAFIHYSDPHEPYFAEDSPPDTELFVDGVFRERFCLANSDQHPFRIRLRPGVTVLQFRGINKNDQGSSTSGFIQKIGCAPSSGIEIIFKRGWRKERLQKGRDRWYFDSTGTLDLVNKNSEAVDVKVRFSGEIAQSFSDVLRNYAAEVKQIDKSIGALWQKVERMGIAHKTILVITADHGEGLKSHGHMGHGYPLYNELLKVPLLIYYPYLSRKGNKVDHVVDHLDIMPTILDLAHVKPPPMKGGSLGKYVTWSPSQRLFQRPGRQSITFASTPEGVKRSFAVQDGKFKLIQISGEKNWHYKAYDLSADPMERNNLFRIDPDLLRKAPFAEWKGLLADYARASEAARKSRPKQLPDSEDLEMLQALGYVANFW